MYSYSHYIVVLFYFLITLMQSIANSISGEHKLFPSKFEMTPSSAFQEATGYMSSEWMYRMCFQYISGEREHAGYATSYIHALERLEHTVQVNLISSNFNQCRTIIQWFFVLKYSANAGEFKVNRLYVFRICLNIVWYYFRHTWYA